MLVSADRRHARAKSLLSFGWCQPQVSGGSFGPRSTCQEVWALEVPVKDGGTVGVQVQHALGGVKHLRLKAKVSQRGTREISHAHMAGAHVKCPADKQCLES